MFTHKVLLIDDDPIVLQGYQDTLHQRFDVETALSSEEAFMAVDIRGPFAVIVCDF